MSWDLLIKLPENCEKTYVENVLRTQFPDCVINDQVYKEKTYISQNVSCKDYYLHGYLCGNSDIGSINIELPLVSKKDKRIVSIVLHVNKFESYIYDFYHKYDINSELSANNLLEKLLSICKIINCKLTAFAPYHSDEIEYYDPIGLDFNNYNSFYKKFLISPYKDESSLRSNKKWYEFWK